MKAWGFIFSVELERQRIANILIDEFSDPYVEASKFCARHKLGADVITILGDSIQRQQTLMKQRKQLPDENGHRWTDEEPSEIKCAAQCTNQENTSFAPLDTEHRSQFSLNSSAVQLQSAKVSSSLIPRNHCKEIKKHTDDVLREKKNMSQESSGAERNNRTREISGERNAGEGRRMSKTRAEITYTVTRNGNVRDKENVSKVLPRSEKITKETYRNNLSRIFHKLKKENSLKYEDIKKEKLNRTELLLTPLFEEMKVMGVMLNEKEFIEAGIRLIAQLLPQEKVFFRSKSKYEKEIKQFSNEKNKKMFEFIKNREESKNTELKQILNKSQEMRNNWSKKIETNSSEKQYYNKRFSNIVSIRTSPIKYNTKNESMIKPKTLTTVSSNQNFILDKNGDEFINKKGKPHVFYTTQNTLNLLSEGKKPEKYINTIVRPFYK